METSDVFQKAIKSHLESLASKDALFAETFKKPKKNINDCCTYILNEVKKSGRNALADEEVFGMAVHYYDEDDVKPGAAVKAHVVVSSQGAQPKTKAEPAAKKAPKKLEAIERDLVNQISLF